MSYKDELTTEGCLELSNAITNTSLIPTLCAKIKQHADTRRPYFTTVKTNSRSGVRPDGIGTNTRHSLIQYFTKFGEGESQDTVSERDGRPSDPDFVAHAQRLLYMGTEDTMLARGKEKGVKRNFSVILPDVEGHNTASFIKIHPILQTHLHKSHGEFEALKSRASNSKTADDETPEETVKRTVAFVSQALLARHFGYLIDDMLEAVQDRETHITAAGDSIALVDQTKEWQTTANLRGQIEWLKATMGSSYTPGIPPRQSS